MEKEAVMKIKDYMVSELFQNWTDKFSLYELAVNKDGRKDLRILPANQAFADLTGQYTRKMVIFENSARCPQFEEKDIFIGGCAILLQSFSY